MCKRYDFTKFIAPERQEILQSLTRDEAAVFNRRANGDGVVETALALCESESTVCRRSKAIMHKIKRIYRESATA